MQASPRQLEILFEAMMLGDGTRGKTRWTYGTISKKLADDVQELCFKLGYSANIVADSTPRQNRYYAVNIRGWTDRRNTSEVESNYSHYKHDGWLDYSGKIHCVTVPNHVIYVRRGGKAVWSGNSGNRPDFKWGRIMRTTITQQTARYKGAHYAVFPPELVELLLHMACPPAVCRFCGLPRVRLTSEVRLNTRPGKDVNNGKSGKAEDPNAGFHRAVISKYRQAIIRNRNAGFAECSCNAVVADMIATTTDIVDVKYKDKWVAPLVLDFWGGSGMTHMVAKRMGLSFTYIDANEEYKKLAEVNIATNPWKPGMYEDLPTQKEVLHNILTEDKSAEQKPEKPSVRDPENYNVLNNFGLLVD